MSRQVDIKALVSHIVRGDGGDKCRICLGDTSEGQVYLGDTVMMDGDKAITLSELLETITGVEVEDTPSLPHKICDACMTSVLTVLPFIQLCKQSARKWHEITNFINNFHVPDNTKNLYFAFDGDELNAVTDSTSCTRARASNSKQVLRNFKARLNRKRAYINRLHNKSFKQSQLNSDLKCPECKTTFENIRTLNQHIRDRGVQACVHCKQIINMPRMEEHLLTHNIEAYACKICTETFENEKFLKKHMVANHGKGSAVCVECKRTFPKENCLLAHTKVHKHQWCIGCDKKFSNKTCFKKHICPNPTAGSLTYICDYCSKEYQFKHALKAHIVLNHLRGREHQCHECGKKFISRATLLEHDNTHNRVEDRFICDICGMKYSTRRGYQRHRKKHFDASPRKGKTKSNAETRHECRLCNRNYARNKDLVGHLERAHDINVMCVDITDLSDLPIRIEGDEAIIFTK